MCSFLSLRGWDKFCLRKGCGQRDKINPASECRWWDNWLRFSPWSVVLTPPLTVAEVAWNLNRGVTKKQDEMEWFHLYIDNFCQWECEKCAINWTELKWAKLNYIELNLELNWTEWRKRGYRSSLNWRKWCFYSHPQSSLHFTAKWPNF